MQNDADTRDDDLAAVKRLEDKIADAKREGNDAAAHHFAEALKIRKQLLGKTES